MVGANSEINKAKPGGWGQFIEDQCRFGPDAPDNHEIPYARGHAGLGVFANTRYGDGGYSVYGLFDTTDTHNKRPHAMIVLTGDHELTEVSGFPVQ